MHTSDQKVPRRPCAGPAVAALVSAAVVALAAGAANRPQGRAPEQLACADSAAFRGPGQGGTPGAGETRQPRRDVEGRRDGESRRGRGPMAPFDLGWGGYGRGQETRPPRPHEWAEVQLFMNRYSPRRQAALDELPDDERKEQLKQFVFARYRSLQALQRRDRAAYEQKLAQLDVEDQIFGLVSDWGGAGEADRANLREALRAQVARLVELDLQDRRRRIEWLRKELAEETQKLEQDQGDRDAQVDRRVARYADWADKWAARRARTQAEKQRQQQPDKPRETAPQGN